MADAIIVREPFEGILTTFDSPNDGFVDQHRAGRDEMTDPPGVYSVNYMVATQRDSMPTGGYSICRRGWTTGGQTYYKCRSGDDKNKTLRNLFLEQGGTALQWPLGTFTRLRIFIKFTGRLFDRSNPNVPYNDVDNSGAYAGNMHIGTYCLLDSNNTSNTTDDTLSDGRQGHLYHYYANLGGSGWQQYILDPAPSHARGNQGGSLQANSYIHRPYDSQPGHGYFDCMADLYTQWTKSTEVPDGERWHDQYDSRWELFDEGVDDIGIINRIRNLTATHISGDTIAFGLDLSDTLTIATNYTVEVRYSNSGTTYGQNWADLIPMTNFQTTERASEGYLQRHWREDVDFNGGNIVYVAFSVQGMPELGHREIAVTNDGSIPPLPGGIAAP